MRVTAQVPIGIHRSSLKKKALRNLCRGRAYFALILRLQFVRRTLFWCGAVAPRVTAALLGRFLPRLGPLAIAGGPFFFQ